MKTRIAKKFVEGYMCMIDFEHELGAAAGGNKVYASVEDLKEEHDCWRSCGIVKVNVSYVATVEPQDLNYESVKCETSSSSATPTSDTKTS